MTDPAAERPAVRRGGTGGAVAVGMLAGGMAALVVAQFLPTAPARAHGLSIWVRIPAVLLIPLGIGAVVMPLWRARPESPWTDSHRWRIALGLGAALVGTWAVLATIADIRSGLPGPAIPLLAVGCVAMLVAAVLLAVSPPVPGRRGSVARQALPAAVALVTVAAVAAVVEVAAPWIPVNGTTAERVDPAAVPDPPRGVGWTSTWPLRQLYRQVHDPIDVVAAGAGVIVASSDRIVALDGPTGAERWHHRWAGTWISNLAATPDGRTVVATVAPGGDERSSTVLFAFDANTGDVRWSRQPGWGGAATDYVVIDREPGDTLVGVDLGSGEEIWSWKPPVDCESNGLHERSPDAVLVPVICGDPAGARSYVLIGLDDRTGTERWRFTGTTTTLQYPRDAVLTTSPDGRVALYKSDVEGRQYGERQESVLLESARGAVLYRTDGDSDIVGPDLRTPVLRREVPGADARLVLRDLSTGAEHPLASNCPALQRPDGPGRRDELSSLVRPLVTSGSVLVLCFDGHWRFRATPRATIDVHSRSDGTSTATMTATDAVGPIHDRSRVTGLIPAPGAVVLVVQHFDAGPAVVAGLI